MPGPAILCISILCARLVVHLTAPVGTKPSSSFTPRVPCLAFFMLWTAYTYIQSTSFKMILESLLLLSISTQIAARRSVVFTPSSSLSSTLAPPACVTVDFHGQYQGTSVYSIDETKCSAAPRAWLLSLEDATVVLASRRQQLDLEDADILLHVQQARILGAVDITPCAWLASLEEHISTLASQLDELKLRELQSDQQVVLSQPQGTIRPHLLYLDTAEQSAFYSLPRSLLPHVDSIFPSNTVLVAVSKDPLPLPHLAEDVPKWLLDSLRDLHYSPLVDAILQDVKPNVIEKDVRHLTAEDGHADWKTRHSFTDDGRRAGAWIKGGYCISQYPQTKRSQFSFAICYL